MKMNKMYGSLTSGFLSLFIVVVCMLMTHYTMYASYTGYSQVHCKGAETHCMWRLMKSPDASNVSDILFATAAISSSDAWAVGGTNVGDGRANTLIEHWNGKVWSIVSSPNPNAQSLNFLQGVSAVSASDVWAVGYYTDATTGANHTLMEHWNGKLWSVVTTPNPLTSQPDGTFTSVVAISSHNVWAIGYYTDATTGILGTLAEHWNGSQWSIVATPNIGSYTMLYSITAVSANNLWAVGSYMLDSNGNSAALVEHWNGKEWSVVATPAAPTTNNVLLLSVSATSPGDVWAVGSYNTADYASQTLIEHWNGSAWSIMNTPASSTSTTLSGVVTLSKHDVWAVGNSLDSHNVSKTLIEHWDGKQWSVVTSPNPDGTYATLNAIARVPDSGQLFACGYYALPGSSKGGYVAEQTLIETYR